MLLEGIFWSAALSTVGALPLPCALGICGAVGDLVSAVCEVGAALWPCSGPPNSSGAFRDEVGQAPSSPLYAPSIVKRQNSNASSDGPDLAPILGGVLGAVGGLAVVGAIIYAWWSIRRVNQRHAGNHAGGSSSFDGVQSQTRRQRTSKDSRGSSSSNRQSQKKATRGKWQDPWLAPAPKAPRPVSVVKLERTASASNVVQEDRRSESSAVPLKVIYSNVEEEQGRVVPDES